MPPINKTGANIPPTPPAPFVELLATTLRKIRPVMNRTTTRKFSEN